MDFSMIPFTAALPDRQTVRDVLDCNRITEKYGLLLTETQAKELAVTRREALADTGRIEFGGGVIRKLLLAFCDSPYLSMQDYAATMQELIDLFYQFKNETEDRISDDLLIKNMKKLFDGVCQGSLELLAERELSRFARRIRGEEAEENDGDGEDERAEY